MDLLALSHQAAQRMDTLASGALAALDLTPRQAIVLKEVKAMEGCNQHRLVEATGIDRSTLSNILKRLTRHGYIQRVRHKEDARSYVVTLTDKGSAAASEAVKAIGKLEMNLLAGFPMKEGAVLRALELIAHEQQPATKAA